MGEAKYISITGGVAPSLGKGIISPSIGKLLQVRGYKVTIQKFDPYINIGPGTLNPYEHGECYVTIDGHEADLDLGHYEHFLGIQTTKTNNITAGHIYKSVIDKKRRDGYLGKAIQVIPHITDEIRRNVRSLDDKYKFGLVITKVGGTVGDIESLPYLESIRQLKWELSKGVLYVHLTYVLCLAAAGELKAKPTQHSAEELQSTGIQPDMFILRTEHELSSNLCKKVALFCNVDRNTVVQGIDAPIIYEAPILMQAQGLDETTLKKMGLPAGNTPGLGPWRIFLECRHKAEATEPVYAALVDKYDLQDAYRSIREALSQAGTYSDCKAPVDFANNEKLTDGNVAETLKGMSGIPIRPGFGKRGIMGKLVIIKYARIYDIPAFGVCLSMQCIAIEFARNVSEYTDANSCEMDEKTLRNVIDIMKGQESITNTGGTMRLGAYEYVLQEDSKASKAYGTERIRERHRRQYEFNNAYKVEYEAAGTKCTGVSPKSDSVGIVEVPMLE